MDIQIQVNEEKRGMLAYQLLPIYRVICEQLGFPTEWDREKKILHLNSSLKGKKIYFIPSEENDTHTSILESSKMFLGHAGIEHTILPPNSSAPNDGELALQLNFNLHQATRHPGFTIFY